MRVGEGEVRLWDGWKRGRERKESRAGGKGRRRDRLHAIRKSSLRLYTTADVYTNYLPLRGQNLCPGSGTVFMTALSIFQIHPFLHP
jgi:hypothetical protein